MDRLVSSPHFVPPTAPLDADVTVLEPAPCPRGAPAAAMATAPFSYAPFCAQAFDKYAKVAKIGQGTFGEVFKARSRQDPSQVVALKKVLMENEREGFPITAIREITLLQQLKPRNP